MRTVVRGPVPPELAALIDRRRRTGADLDDEVWSGEDLTAAIDWPAVA